MATRKGVVKGLGLICAMTCIIDISGGLTKLYLFKDSVTFIFVFDVLIRALLSVSILKLSDTLEH